MCACVDAYAAVCTEDYHRARTAPGNNDNSSKHLMKIQQLLQDIAHLTEELAEKNRIIADNEKNAKSLSGELKLQQKNHKALEIQLEKAKAALEDARTEVRRRVHRHTHRD